MFCGSLPVRSPFPVNAYLPLHRFRDHKGCAVPPSQQRVGLFVIDEFLGGGIELEHVVFFQLNIHGTEIFV